VTNHVEKIKIQKRNWYQDLPLIWLYATAHGLNLKTWKIYDGQFMKGKRSKTKKKKRTEQKHWQSQRPFSYGDGWLEPRGGNELNVMDSIIWNEDRVSRIVEISSARMRVRMLPYSTHLNTLKYLKQNQVPKRKKLTQTNKVERDTLVGEVVMVVLWGISKETSNTNGNKTKGSGVSNSQRFHNTQNFQSDYLDCIWRKTEAHQSKQ